MWSQNDYMLDVIYMSIYTTYTIKAILKMHLLNTLLLSQIQFRVFNYHINKRIMIHHLYTESDRIYMQNSKQEYLQNIAKNCVMDK